MHYCFDFLRGISGSDSKFKNIRVYSLNQSYSNHLYQTILEMMFGAQGCVAETIISNDVLNFGQKSFYLKVGMFAEPKVCRRILDHVYSAIVAKKPGHTWGLLTAIKKINEHCYDWQTKYLENEIEYTTKSANALLFVNSGRTEQEKLSPAIVRMAIHYLLKGHIERIAALARIRVSMQEYTEQQNSTVHELDNLDPNAEWRFLIFSIPHAYICELGSEMCRKSNNLESMHLQNITDKEAAHRQICQDDICTLRILIEEHQAREQRYEQREQEMLLAGEKRIVEELAAMREIERAKFQLRAPSP